jgi:hypothetical protein
VQRQAEPEAVAAPTPEVAAGLGELSAADQEKQQAQVNIASGVPSWLTGVDEPTEEQRAQAEGLLDRLAELHARGPALGNGSVVEFGWVPLKLVADGVELVVCEPDFSGDPWQNYVPMVDVTLRVLSWQAQQLQSLGVAGVPAHCYDTLVLERDCLGNQRIYAQRSAEMQTGDSGWYIGAVDKSDEAPAADKLAAVYIYQLLQSRPAAMAVLALPPGYLTILDGDTIEAIFDDQGMPV